MTQTGNGIAAPYGRSCKECARAKTKCIMRDAGDTCMRCHRLNRDCLPSASKRKRPTKTNATDSQFGQIDETAKRTVRLERKLDELVASVKANGTTVISAPVSENSTSVQNFTTKTPDSVVVHHVPAALGTSFCVALANNSVSFSPSLSALQSEPWGMIGVSPAEAEEYLETFRAYHLKYFPFVHIPVATAAELRVHQPYLWLAILTTGSLSVPRQQRLGDLFRREIAEAMVVRSEKSIDLLLALLTYIGWFHNQFRAENGTPKTALSMLTQLAISQAFDLHLTKPVALDPQQTLGFRFHNQPDHPRQLTMEEMRAVLGCFLITSIISSYLQKTDSLRWTSQLNDCLRQLSDKPECEGDEILVQHVRMQLVVEKTLLASWYDTSIEPSGLLPVPSSLVFQAKFWELHQIRDNLSIHLRNNNIVLAQFHSTQLSIAEILLWQTPAELAQPNFTRQKYMYACLSSARAWLDIRRSFSIMGCLAFPFSFASQSVRCFSILLYLSTLEEPGWDKSLVKREVDVIRMMDEWVEQLEEGTTSVPPNGEENILTRHCNFWKSIRPSVLAKLEGPDATADSAAAPTVGSPNDIGMGEMFDWDFFDNEWLSSMTWLGLNGTQPGF